MCSVRVHEVFLSDIMIMHPHAKCPGSIDYYVLLQRRRLTCVHICLRLGFGPSGVGRHIVTAVERVLARLSLALQLRRHVAA